MESIYIANTAIIDLRDDTLLFRLLGKGKKRREALVKIFQEHLDPYVTLIENFSREFREEMAGTELNQSITPHQWKKIRDELTEIESVRADVLLQRGREEGREEGARLLLLRLLSKKFPSVKEWEPLLQQIENIELLEQLFDEALESDNSRQILRRVKTSAKGQ